MRENSQLWNGLPFSNPSEQPTFDYKDVTLVNAVKEGTSFEVLLPVHLSIYSSVINKLEAQNLCFTISLFHASTCFEHMCSSSGGQNCITQPL